MEGNDLCIVGGQRDAVRKHHLEEGDQRLETELAATSHIGLLSSFSVYFPGMPPAWGVCCQQCSAAGHAVHSALSLPLLGDTAHFLCFGPPWLVASPALNCHINRVSSAPICWIVASPCVPGWSCFCITSYLTLATSATLAPRTLSHSLLQSLSSLQPRAILREQIQA